MTKAELLDALARFKQERIRGLLIEIEFVAPFEPPEDFYDTLRHLVEETLAQHQSPFLDSLDWEVGHTRFKPDFLVHLFHDECMRNILALAMSATLPSGIRCRAGRTLQVMTALLHRIAALDVAGMCLFPAPEFFIQ
jgi:hypothetical protein